MKKPRINASTPDAENPELDEAFFRAAKPFEEAFPELHAAWKRGRGRPKKASPKISTTLRLDAEVLQAFKAGGTGWQSRMNDALKAWVSEHRV